jgi:hypothetical protein
MAARRTLHKLAPSTENLRLKEPRGVNPGGRASRLALDNQVSRAEKKLPALEAPAALPHGRMGRDPAKPAIRRIHRRSGTRPIASCFTRETPVGHAPREVGSF